jgi:hypothetical protein
MVAMINASPSNAKRAPHIGSGGVRTRRAWARKKVANRFHNFGIAYYEHLVRKGRRRPRRSPWDLQYIASSRARMHYVAPASGLEIDWFGARAPAEAAHAAMWEPFVKRVDFHPVVGTERDRWKLVFLTRPQVDSLAAAIRQTIDARTADRSPA